jgi:hypothetical protein
MKRGDIVRWDVQSWQAKGNWSESSSTDFNQQLDAIRDNDASLDKLMLSNCKFAYDDIENLMEAMSDNESVTHLNLSYNNFTYREIKLLAELATNRTITILKLWKNDLRCEGARALLPLLQSSVQPGDAWYHQHINSGGLPNDWCTITSLNLGENNIGDEGAAAIAEALAQNCTVTTLQLDQNPITCVGATAIAESLVLPVLYVGEKKRPYNKNLKNLNLPGTLIREDGACALAVCLRSNTSLTSLNVWGCNVGSKGAGSLSETYHSPKYALSHLKIHQPGGFGSSGSPAKR